MPSRAFQQATILGSDGTLNLTDITGLATVAGTGSYTDLINKPSTTSITEGTNLYYTDSRARAAITVTGSGTYDSNTGVITVTGDVTTAKLKRVNWFNND